jgi:hypothetical protein
MTNEQIDQHIAERRNDDAFMRRLAGHMETEKAVHERLRNGPKTYDPADVSFAEAKVAYFPCCAFGMDATHQLNDGSYGPCPNCGATPTEGPRA